MHDNSGSLEGRRPAAPPAVQHPRLFPPLELRNHASALLRASTGIDGMGLTRPHPPRIVRQQSTLAGDFGGGSGKSEGGRMVGWSELDGGVVGLGEGQFGLR